MYFLERFRMSKEKFDRLVDVLNPFLQQSNRGGGLSTNQIVEVALHFLGSGAQYHVVGDMHGISKATVCRCVKKFVRSVNRNLYRQYIRFPENMWNVSQRFHEIARMPQVRCNI